jgi:hypothetical protein
VARPTRRPSYFVHPYSRPRLLRLILSSCVSRTFHIHKLQSQWSTDNIEVYLRATYRVTYDQWSDDRWAPLLKGRCTLSVKLSDFTVWRHTWRKNWVNCAVLTGNSAGLKTVLSSRLSHRELRSSLRESYSFLSLPADTTMASSQSTQHSKINKRKATANDRLVFIHRSHMHKKTHRTDRKQLTNMTGNLCCAREHSVQFFVQFFYTVKLHSLT